MGRKVQAAIATLPERQRAALILTHYEELSNDEAAAVLGTSLGGLESLLVRGRRTLREKLALVLQDWKEA
jgi:RNA polymerase sigma-70 factor (ECF subfamily)